MKDKTIEIRCEIDSKTGKGMLKSPWGESDASESLDSIRHCLKQLRHFQKEKDTAHLRADIEGYELILASNVEENADNFLETKDKSRQGLVKRFTNNLEVIQFLKENGLWRVLN